MSAGVLRLLALNLPSEPLFTKVGPGESRVGYEVDVAQEIAKELGVDIDWVFLPWSELIPTLRAGRGDAILCGQGITPERRALVDFTRPYAILDEAVLVKAGSGIRSAEDLAGRRVLAIDGSTNMKLAESFEHAIVVPFPATGDDVLADLVEELRAGRVDAVVDDEVVLHPLCRDGEFQVAFSRPTANRWAVAVAKGNAEMRGRIDGALARATRCGAIEQAWRRWMPEIEVPEELRAHA